MKIVDPKTPDGGVQIQQREQKQQRAQAAGEHVRRAKRVIFIYLGIGMLAPI
jgi:hypothetical protein